MADNAPPANSSQVVREPIKILFPPGFVKLCAAWEIEPTAVDTHCAESLMSSQAHKEQRALEESCRITVKNLLAVVSVIQALPTCMTRGAIRSKNSPIAKDITGVFAIHHLIPVAFATHDIVRRVTDRWKQNDPVANGIALPTSSAQGLALSLPYHRGPHPEYSRQIGVSLDRIAKFRDMVNWNSDCLLPVFTNFVSQVRAAVLAMLPGVSVNHCPNLEWNPDDSVT